MERHFDTKLKHYLPVTSAIKITRYMQILRFCNFIQKKSKYGNLLKGVDIYQHYNLQSNETKLSSKYRIAKLLTKEIFECAVLSKINKF